MREVKAEKVLGGDDHNIHSSLPVSDSLEWVSSALKSELARIDGELT